MDDDREFTRRDTPPPVRKIIKIARITSSDICTGIILSEKMEGFDFHFDPVTFRTLPCYSPVETCPWHALEMPIKWYGFLHLLDRHTGNQFYVQLTPYATKGVEQMLELKGRLRGLEIEVRREKGHKRGPLVVRFLNDLWAEKAWPPGVSPKDTLRALFPDPRGRKQN